MVVLIDLDAESRDCGGISETTFQATESSGAHRMIPFTSTMAIESIRQIEVMKKHQLFSSL